MRWCPPAPTPAPVVTHQHCRACPEGANTRLQPLLDLGPLSPVAFPLTPDRLPHPPVPIDVRRCPRCALVQLSHTIPTGWRYGEYWYRSGTNTVMVKELTDVVQGLRARGVGRDVREVVVDLGANDGTLLEAWATTRGAGGHVPYRIGVEPAPNLYEALAPRADAVIQACFPGIPTHDLEGVRGRCAAVTAIAMAYAQDAPVEFLRGIAGLLAPDGWAVVQFQDLRTVLRTSQIDYFCHEHLLTLSAYSLANLAHEAGLDLVDVESRAVNGGSLRGYLRKPRRGRKADEAGLRRVLAEVECEALAGVGPSASEARIHAPWDALAAQVRTLTDALQGMITKVLDSGGEVDLYGASTKGLVLAEVCGLKAGLVRQVWERAPQKVGRYYGATGIPIVSETKGRAVPPTVLVVPVWQFREAVIVREEGYLRGGGRLLFPLPVPELVWWEDGAVQVKGVAA